MDSCFLDEADESFSNPLDVSVLPVTKPIFDVVVRAITGDVLEEQPWWKPRMRMQQIVVESAQLLVRRFPASRVPNAQPYNRGTRRQMSQLLKELKEALEDVPWSRNDFLLS